MNIWFHLNVDQNDEKFDAINDIGDLKKWREFLLYYKKNFDVEDKTIEHLAKKRIKVWTTVKRFTKLINRWLSNIAAYMVFNRDYIDYMFAICLTEKDVDIGLWRFMLILTYFACIELWGLWEATRLRNVLRSGHGRRGGIGSLASG